MIAAELICLITSKVRKIFAFGIQVNIVLVWYSLLLFVAVAKLNLREEVVQVD